MKTYQHQAATLYAAVEERVSQQIATGFAKTKLASRLTYGGQKVYECRVNAPKLPAIRVAFTVKDGAVCVVFMSTDIQKSTFSEAITGFLNSRT